MKSMNKVILEVKSASNLINVDFGINNKSDPYVKAIFRGEERKTKHIDNDLNPVWTAEHDNVLEWDLGPDPLVFSDELHIKVKDYERILQKKLLGQVTIPLKDLLRTKDHTIEQTYPLVDSHHNRLVSTLSLKLQYKPPRQVLSYMRDETDADKPQELHTTDDYAEDEEGKVERRESGRQLSRVGVRREWSTRKRNFKITVKIHEGRQIPGINISPVARVTVKNSKKETRVKKATNSPSFNQTFTFNFPHCSEAELFDERIDLEVFNSRKILLRNALIGFFECDIGAIYEKQAHSIVRKWVLLTGAGIQDDDDEDDQKNGLSKWLRRRGRFGGTAGYLKVTISVQGSGDEALSLRQLEAQVDDEDDIEKNCLTPVGVTREPAEFHLKVFMAEDLPQMDPGFITTFRRLFLPGNDKTWDPNEKKKLVDPYLVFSFSGKEVKTKTEYRTNTPSFNQELRLPVMYPTMSKRIKFQLFDKDRGPNENDVIATSFLSLSQISGNDSSAFSPHFGPCFVNFYGSPREYKSINTKSDENLNKGIGEGVAYRGRALVELDHQTWSSGDSSKVFKIHDEDIVRVQPFLRQEKYKLFACFKNAAMISKNDKAIEFEVSIGNFGNKMDETEVACNTPPTNPVYDGSHYHYLPWHHYKPCICLNCNWENVSFRIGPLNVINRLCEQLEAIVAQVKSDMKCDDEQEIDEEQESREENKEETRKSSVKKSLQHIIQICSHAKQYITKPKNTPPYNTLDVTLAETRREELNKIIQDAKELVQTLMSQEVADLNKIVQYMEDYAVRLKNLAFEPQISIPDVIIWMLYGGNRLAYHRVPIQDVMYSKNIDERGKYCGKTMELLMKYPGAAKLDNEYEEVPAMVRVELWVGLGEYQQDWISRESQKGDFKIFAETYQNEIKTPLVGWTKHFSLRPHFSNASGDVPLDMKNFVLPKEWEFRGEEKAVLDRSLMYEEDWALSNYEEEIWEHQRRDIIGGQWNSESRWTEKDGQPSRSIHDFQIRPGWKWTDAKWKVDINRAVDANGWEYCIVEGVGEVYVKAAKVMHMMRRRRWVRSRTRDEPPVKHTLVRKESEGGWEYATTFDSKFHIDARNKDFVRRRRFLKEIVPRAGGKIASLGLPPRLAVDLKRAKPKKSKTKEKKSKTEESDKESQVTSDDSYEMEKGCLAVNPRMFIVYEKPHKFHLWVYVYQGRSLLAKDDSGESDPYVRVAFCNQSQKTEWKRQTLTPKWDQTLIFKHLELFETIENIIQSPPQIIMEVFDRDSVGKHDFIGRCLMKPVVQTKGDSEPPSLTWLTLDNRAANAGQVLAAAELFLDEGQQMPSLPKPKESHTPSYIFPVRKGIRPELQRVALEILCWGVRNMENYNFRSVNHPSVKFEWGDAIISSEKLENAAKNPNFSKPALHREIVKIESGHFAPAMEIRVYDNRSFNRKPPLVGVATIPSIELSTPATLDFDEVPASPFSPFPTTKKQVDRHKKEKEKFDWWSKYNYSMETNRKKIKRDSKIWSIFSTDDEGKKDHLAIYKERKYDSIQIYDKELEKVEEFEGLNDFVKTFKLKRGKSKNEGEDEDDVVGELKANIRVYPVDSEERLPPGLFSNLSEVKMKWPIKCVVRVYVICAFDLQAHDMITGLADPYLSVSVGGITRTSEEVHYNTLNPVFGEMFEFNPSIPVVKDLKIKVIDKDQFVDEDIGETTIDLEQRLLSRYHASCGLPKLYYVDGPFVWRDCKRPKDILKEYCHAKGYVMKFYNRDAPTTLVLTRPKNGPVKMNEPTKDFTFHIDEIVDFDESNHEYGSRDQQLSLHALHRLGLVPEHVETRSLYSSILPGLEQGKLQLWVDIFPRVGNVDIKPAVDIKPRTPIPYVLRVVIWDTTEVELQETSFTGDRMSDIYVKGWIEGINKKQKTDIHYRSLNGVGNFNWRMSFPMSILPIENKLVHSEKGKIYHIHETKRKFDPILKIQIWDNDLFPAGDDFLGTRTLKLDDLPKPCRNPRSCATKDDPSIREDRPRDYVDLFHEHGPKVVRGWYACWKDETSKNDKPGGKVDLQIELLTEKQAKDHPAGPGRSDPNQHPFLPEPDRPKTSFLWLTSPFKSMRFIVWRHYKWYIIGFIITVLLVLLILLFVYNVPGYSVKKLFRV